MTNEEITAVRYAKIILKIASSLNRMANAKYEHHVKREAGKRNQPYFHESNGLIHAYNRVSEIYDEEVPDEIKMIAVKEFQEEKAASTTVQVSKNND